MPSARNRNNIVLFAVIATLIVVLGVAFPLIHEYSKLFTHDPQISVQNGYSNVTFSGDFKDGYQYTIPWVNATAFFGEQSYNNFLTLSFVNGTGDLYYIESTVRLFVNVSISGQLTTNLHPSTISVKYNATGPKGEDGVIFLLISPIPYNGSYGDRNVTFNYGQGGGFQGYGNGSEIGNLVNENASTPLYNFTLNLRTWLTFNWYQNSTHNFAITATLNGLSEEVSSTINFAIKEA